MNKQKQEKNIDVVAELKTLPDPREYQNKPVKNTVDWFSMNLIFSIIITFLFAGLIVVYSIV